MIFGYSDEGSGEPVQFSDSPEPSLLAHEIFGLIALSSDYMARSSLPKCADSPESLLLA